MATFTVRGKNIEITPSLREYVEKRVGKVTKYFENVGDITVLLTVSKGRHIVEVTVPVQGGILLRGEEAVAHGAGLGQLQAQVAQVYDVGSRIRHGF